MDLWNPDQYKKFQNERARPFWDLVQKVDFAKVYSVLDIGCGTGELTQALHLAHQIPKTLGFDSSAKMLEEAQVFRDVPGLQFERAEVETFAPVDKFDLVLSNAALQWVENHRELLPRILQWLKSGGQLAIQMPMNHDHPSHRIAEDVAREFGLKPRQLPLLAAEDYAQLLWNAGLHNIDVSTKIYLHPMPSSRDVVEWTKGTLLTHYQKKLSPTRFEEFLKEYTRAILHDTGSGTYLYTFKRLFLFATRD